MSKKTLNLETDQLKKDEWRNQLVITPSDKDYSSYLQRWNKVQREQLEHELKRIDREEKRVLRDAHLDRCAVAKAHNDLKREQAMIIQQRVNASVQGKLAPISSATSQRLGTPSAGAPKSPRSANSSARRTSISDMAGLFGQNLSVGPMTNLSKSTSALDKIADDMRGNASLNTDSGQRNETERRSDHIDHKRQEELARMRRAADKTTRSWNTEFTEHSKSLSRTGAPLLPTSTFSSSKDKADIKKSASRESVFDRLSKNTNIASMSQDVFLKNVKTRAAQRPVRHPSGGGNHNDGNLLTVAGSHGTTRRARSLSPRFRIPSEHF